MKHTDGESLSIKDIVRISRPLWWLAAAVPFFVGYMATKGKLQWDAPYFVGIAYCLTAYNLLLHGMHDIFDYGRSGHEPQRAGTVEVVLAPAKRWPLLLVILFVNLPFWAYFVQQGSAGTSMFLMLMIFAVFAYNVPGLRFREIPGLDSITTGFQYTAPFVFGVLFAGGSNIWPPAFLAFFLWAVACHAFGAIKNINHRVQANTGSIATRLGTEKTLVLCLSLNLVAATLPVLYYGLKGVFASALLLGSLALLARTVPHRATPDHPIFARTCKLLVYYTYVMGFLLGLSLWVMR
jgi:4-hydroxybenzoate polyprenyltransferase